MEWLEFGYAAAVLFIAYLVRGVAGFGSGLIAIPLLALAYPITLVVPVVVTLDYLGSGMQGVRNRGHIAWRDLLPLLPFTVLGVAGALYAFHSVRADVLTRSLGAFVIVYAVYQLMPVPPTRGTRRNAIAYGFFGGLVGTLFGTGGPFYVVYLTLRGLDRVTFRASFAAWFLIDGTMRLVGYAVIGAFTTAAAKYFAAALPFAALGLWVGGRIQVGLSATAFRRIISALLLGSGVALILKPV